MDDARGPGIDTPGGYTRMRRIGSGAEADVYQAWEEHSQEWVVLQLLHGYVAGRTQEQDFADRYGSAVRLGGHPGIVPVRAGGVTATGRAWLVTDLVEGDTLAAALRSGPIAVDRALALTAVLADALAWAHAMHPPVTHGRLDAEHVLLAADGRPLLTGFAFLAGRRPPRDDVAALAGLLGHALTGRPGVITPAELSPDLAGVPGLLRLLGDGLTTSSAAEFAYRLRDVAARLLSPALAVPSGPFPVLQAPSGTYPVLSDATYTRLTAPAALRPTSLPGPSSPYGGKKRRRLAGIAALALILVVGAAVGVLRIRADGTDAPPPAATPAATVPVAAGTGGAAAAPACPPATTDLVAGGDHAPAAWWPLDEGAGPVACDASGNGNTATLSSAAGWRATGPKALSLTAATADSYAATDAPAVRTDRSFTVTAWVYLTDKSAPHGVLSQPGDVSSGFILKYEKLTDSWRLIMPESDVAKPVVDGPSSTSTPKLRTWTHLAARYDASQDEITLFVNGKSEDTAEHTDPWNATGPAQIARSWYNGAWTDRFAGSIADVRAYQAALPAAEISAISKIRP
ncbi:LamG-like jellyroll fold domain-containing protein [Actinoplanes sp. L3-i22]|uniref:LamG-like jellyroll fold domain-containing protein n=1 Tax=Actinoplanes sp. L3-i22 TaxID=2836373 RepID=UPI001C76CA72|nr:LamG-like jellyroll fold domain-containing protein [Actinoplanes sp. L3-i22]BCY06558.1 hypothetical protein L3i22_016460 [Actinoplanes sp. L3-i22]